MKKRILLEQKLLFAKELVRRQSTAEDAKAFEDILIINDLYVKRGTAVLIPSGRTTGFAGNIPLLSCWKSGIKIKSAAAKGGNLIF